MKPVDTSAPNSYKRIVAWVPNRGTASPALASPPTGWAHYSCIETQKKSPVDAGSEPMF